MNSQESRARNPAELEAELSHLANINQSSNAQISVEQYQRMQNRINVLTQELKKYKKQAEQDDDGINRYEQRRHRRHHKGKKNTF